MRVTVGLGVLVGFGVGVGMGVKTGTVRVRCVGVAVEAGVEVKTRTAVGDGRVAGTQAVTSATSTTRIINVILCGLRFIVASTPRLNDYIFSISQVCLKSVVKEGKYKRKNKSRQRQKSQLCQLVSLSPLGPGRAA